jgi:zinc and cadmium transporter
MNNIWFNSLLSVILVSLISLIGAIAFSLNTKKLKKYLYALVSFSAGALLGGVFVHLLPEIAQEQGMGINNSLLILAGILIFFIMEKIIFWRHCHVISCDEHPHTLGTMNLIGDALHNFTDGIIISAAYLVKPSLGVAATIAVALHEIPQEIGDFSVLIYAGFSKRKALLFNFFSALTAMLGAILTLLIGGGHEQIINYLVPITAGGFIYIATADLIPELKKEEKLSKTFIQLASLLAGILIMLVIRSLG